MILPVSAGGSPRPATISRLAKITAPTLIVHGADATLIAPAAREDTVTCIHIADFMVIDGMRMLIVRRNEARPNSLPKA